MRLLTKCLKCHCEERSGCEPIRAKQTRTRLLHFVRNDPECFRGQIATSR
ncbi:MAG: hypothetical protein QME16_01800 [Planctomycetota bacterium]|nr:hypothetical protein [Planctomycetota bacterium]